MHPTIYFRKQEYDELKASYEYTKDSIDDSALNYFADTFSLESLYSKVSKLENAESIIDGFNYKKSQSIFVKGDLSETYACPFSFSHEAINNINFLGSKFIFFASIFFLLLLIFTVIKKFKILRNLVAIIFTGLILFNFINYYIIEPNTLLDHKEKINFANYKKRVYKIEACNKFDELYVPEVRENNYNSNNYYEYDVYGRDEDDNPVKGYVFVDNEEGGEGYIYDFNNNKIDIIVKWVGNGELEGSDRDRKTYILYVD